MLGVRSFFTASKSPLCEGTRVSLEVAISVSLERSYHLDCVVEGIVRLVFAGVTTKGIPIIILLVRRGGGGFFGLFLFGAIKLYNMQN